MKYVEKLKAAGVPDARAKAEAEALVSAFSEAMEARLTTKNDINGIEKKLVVFPDRG